MISVDMTATGILALVAEGLAPNLVRRLRRAAQKQALEEWVQRRGFPGLGARFSGAYMGNLGLSERSPNYVKRVIKKWGKYLPYTSPFRDGRHAHMRELVRSEDGHRITNKNKPDEVTTVLFLSGAKVLNLLQGDKSKFRREFLGLARRASADREWIEKRANEIFSVTLRERIDAQQEKTIRARGRLNRLLESAD